MGVYLNLPLEYPLDHPDLHPLWRAMDEAGLCYIHHSFSEGYPGYRDLWRNPFLGRTASHPWGAMRAMGAFFGAGLLDRYANLRFAVLESGFGWIPFWAVRMQDQAHYMGYVADGLEHSMLEYTAGGRFFASIVLHEGGEMVKMVSDFVGDHVLMGGNCKSAGFLTIGDHSILYAGTAVSKDFPAQSRLAGVPARDVKQWRREVAALTRLGRRSHHQ